MGGRSEAPGAPGETRRMPASRCSSWAARGAGVSWQSPHCSAPDPAPSRCAWESSGHQPTGSGPRQPPSAWFLALARPSGWKIPLSHSRQLCLSNKQDTRPEPWWVFGVVVKTLPGTPTPAAEGPSSSPVFPQNPGFLEAAGDDPRTGLPVIHTGDPPGTPSSRLQPGPVLANCRHFI